LQRLGTGATDLTVTAKDFDNTAYATPQQSTALASVGGAGDVAEVRGRVIMESVKNFSTGAGNVGADGVDKTGADTKTAAVLSAVGDVDLSTQVGSNNALSVIDKAIAKIDSIRGSLGAVQNRFESTISNLTNVSENISASRSRVLDADFAKETAQLTKQQIIQQAGLSMLSQANQLPQAALSLLQ